MYPSSLLAAARSGSDETNPADNTQDCIVSCTIVISSTEWGIYRIQRHPISWLPYAMDY